MRYVFLMRLNNHIHHRHGWFVGDGDVEGGGFARRRQGLEAGEGAAGEGEGGAAAWVVDDADIAHEDAMREPGAEGFGASLLRREAFGVGGDMGASRTAAFGFGDFLRGEAPMDKAIAKARQRFFNAADVD